MRAPNSGIHLADADAAIVKGMIARGDRQHDIAAWFGVNGGRIGEVSSGDRFADVPAQFDNLPPPGPYLSGRSANEAKMKLIEGKQALQKIIGDIDEMISNIDRR